MNAIVAGVRRPERQTEHSVDLAPVQLTVRCFAEKEADQWLAFSIELGLAAQADTLPEVKHKLEAMISTYVHDAVAGEDREHAYELLTRKAPLSVRLRYHTYSLLDRVRRASDRAVYTRPLPLEPAACHA